MVGLNNCFNTRSSCSKTTASPSLLKPSSPALITLMLYLICPADSSGPTESRTTSPSMSIVILTTPLWS